MHLEHALLIQSLRDEIAQQRLRLFGSEFWGPIATVRADFHFSPYHLPRVLGKHQEHLARAPSLRGIVHITVDQRSGQFSITASDEESAVEAKNLLNFVTDVAYVEQAYIGHVIGRSGCDVQEIKQIRKRIRNKKKIGWWRSRFVVYFV